MQKIHALLFLVMPLAAAGAQSPATVGESRVITEKNGGKPDTLLMRTTVSHARMRLDVSGPASLTEPWRSMGTAQVTIVTDSGAMATMLHTTRKTYWTTMPGSALANIVKSTGLDEKPVTPADRLTIDSVGDGGGVAGYHTIHFRSHSTTRLTMNLLGHPASWTDARTTDYYVAPGVHFDALGYTMRSAATGKTPPSASALPSGLKEIAAENGAAMQRMARIGTIVKTVTESRTTEGDSTRTRRKTMELLSHRITTVPDSLFVVPAGYTKAMPRVVHTR